MALASKPPTPSPKQPTDESGWRFKPLSTPTEWIESYRPGGLHPIHPGDILGPSGESRYNVVCKLGYGAFSTVWLAEDLRRSKLVAIKVARADARQVLDELQVYKMLAQSDTEGISTKHVVMPIDDFRQTGPNGEHQCLVFEPMGPSAGYILEGVPPPSYETGSDDTPPPPPPNADLIPRFTLDQRKTLLKQLLLGLDCLHKSKIAHGDVNPGNLLLCIRPFSSQDVQKLLESSKSSARSRPVKRLDGKQDLWAPRYLCIEQPLTDWVEMDHRMHAKISDLGAAFTFDTPPKANECATPAALRAPEIILGGPIDHKIDEKIDIWSFGCLVYELLTDQRLFQISGFMQIPQEQEENDDDHLLQMVDTLGLPPPEIFSRWSRRRRYFNEELKLIRHDVGPGEMDPEDELYQGPSLEDAFRESMPEGMAAEEGARVLSLLRKILQYEPGLRPSTSELLEDEWFQSIE